MFPPPPAVCCVSMVFGQVQLPRLLVLFSLMACLRQRLQTGMASVVSENT